MDVQTHRDLVLRRVQCDCRGDGKDDYEDETGEALAIALGFGGAGLLLLRKGLATFEIGVFALTTLALHARDAVLLLGFALVYLCLGACGCGASTLRALALLLHLALAALLELFGLLALLLLIDGVVFLSCAFCALVSGALTCGLGCLAVTLGVLLLPCPVLGSLLGGPLALLRALLLLAVRLGLLARAASRRLALRH